MRLGLGVLALSVCAIFPVTDASAVSQRPKLAGFANVRFGMSESEMQGVASVVKSENTLEDDPEIAWFDGTGPIDIGGYPFMLRIMVQRGVVRRIGAGHIVPAQGATCRPNFDALVAYVTAQYGPPDESFQRGTRDSYRAGFAFEDHAYIEIMSGMHVDNKSCLELIMAYAPSSATP